MKILLTGGAGYIGSHILVELVTLGYDVIVIDNLSNSSIDAIKAVEAITKKPIHFIKANLKDKAILENIFETYNIDTVVHLAGLKSIEDSLKKPTIYFENNVIGTLNLLQVMKKFSCKKIIFSSSAVIYNHKNKSPMDEDALIDYNSSPYAFSKYIIESILQDLYKQDISFQVLILRYFNPMGAHKSGLIGEYPNNSSKNLMPLLCQVAMREKKCLEIFGNDYATFDGTGIRDFIHVVDLANAHVKALKYIINNTHFSPQVFNLGTGDGNSVLDVIKTFEKVNKLKIPYELKSRRLGDIPICYANSNKAQRILNWNAIYSLEDMCEDSWRWINKINGATGEI